MEHILISGRSEAKYRVAEQLVRNRTDCGRPVILVDFEWRGRLLPRAEQATFASFLGYLNKKELVDVYGAMAAAHDLRVNRAAMRRLLELIWEYYSRHNERLTIEELRTLNVQELKAQVRRAGDGAFLQFLESHETGLGEVEDAIVALSEAMSGESLVRIRPDLQVRVEGPSDEESPEGRAFTRLLPERLRDMLKELAALGEQALLVIQGTPYEASAIIDKLTRLPADLLVLSNDVFGMAEGYHASILARMDKCLVYCHALESSGEKWARKMGTHTVRRASVSQAPPPRGMFGRGTPMLMTPRNAGMAGALDMRRSGVVVGSEERLQVLPEEILQLGPEECFCIDQRNGTYCRM